MSGQTAAAGVMGRGQWSEIKGLEAALGWWGPQPEAEVGSFFVSEAELLGYCVLGAHMLAWAGLLLSKCGCCLGERQRAVHTKGARLSPPLTGDPGR